jgi:hypothetical protein
MDLKCYKFTRDVNFPQKGPDGKTPTGFVAQPGDTLTQITHTTYQFSDGYQEREIILSDLGISTMIGHGWLEEIGTEEEEEEPLTDPYEVIAQAQAQIAAAQATIDQVTANTAIQKAAALRPVVRPNTPTPKPVPTPQAPKPIPHPTKPVVPAPTPKSTPKPALKPIGKVVAPAVSERTSPVLESALGDPSTGAGPGQLSEAEAINSVLSRVKRVTRPRETVGTKG